jgi:hypothetical protein
VPNNIIDRVGGPITNRSTLWGLAWK